MVNDCVIHFESPASLASQTFHDAFINKAGEYASIDGRNKVTTYQSIDSVYNHPPSIVSIPNAAAKEDSLYLYKISAIDQDTAIFGDTLTYRLLVKPSWLLIDAVSGLISGTPRGRNVGDSTVTIQVSDGHGGFVTQSYSLNVIHTNHLPVFMSTPNTNAAEDIAYTYSVWATDQDSVLFGDKVHYRLVKPAWLTIDSVTGISGGTPHVQNFFDTTALLQAYDNFGGVSQQQYTIHIARVDHPPVIVSTPLFTASEDTLYNYQVVAHDPDTLIGEILSFSLLQKPSWLSVSSGGLISGIPRGANVGDSAVTVQVNDGHGGIITQSVLD